jgi:molybdopterin converting factor small subunit
MIDLRLSSSLADLLPADQRRNNVPPTVSLSARSWPEAVSEIRTRFPELATRILGDADAVGPGFVLVVNGEVITSSGRVAVADGDRISLLPQIAGG